MTMIFSFFSLYKKHLLCWPLHLAGASQKHLWSYHSVLLQDHSLKISFTTKHMKTLNSGYVDNTIYLFLITQTNVVSLDSSINVYLGSIHFLFRNKRSVESQALKTGIFWSTRKKPDQWPLVSTCLLVSSYILQGKGSKDDRKQSHCPGEISQYFDSLVTLTYANLSVSAL